MPIFFLFIPLMLLGMLVSARLKSKMTQYSQIPISSGLTGKQVAEKMLKDDGIYDVQVVCIEGFLTDHYNPANKTLNLDPTVFNTSSITSAAIAAHETGHAVQHARAYTWLTLRSQLVPIVSISSKFVQWILLAGILLINTFPQLLMAGIVMFACITLFSFITLPVEFDASRRGLAWIESSQIMAPQDFAKAKDGLWWAAMTYVVAAISSLATLLYYLSFFNGRRR
jgi:uncharacterized protein